jgi:hypothetical protein
VLIAGGLVALLVGLIRARCRILRELPGLFFLLLAAAPFVPPRIWAAPTDYRKWLILAAGIFLLVHQILRQRETRDNEEARAREKEGRDPSAEKEGGESSVGNDESEKPVPESIPVRARHKWRILRPEPAHLCFGLILTVAALFLFENLSDYAGSLLVWESPVSREFGKTFQSGQTPLSFLGNRFLWAEGLMSSSQDSLLYGAPTYALFHLFGFKVWVLRVVSVLLTLGSITLIYLIGRRFFGPFHGCAMAALLALNEMVLYYGRYGSSSAGTLFGLLLAIYCTWLFLERERSSWWMGPVCGLSLFLATLQYATARMVVLILLGVIGMVTLHKWREFWWRRAVGTALLALVVWGVWSFEKSHKVERHFHSARGEQFLNFMKSRNYLREYLHRDVDPRTLTGFEKFELLYRVLEITIPQYMAFMSPTLKVYPPGERILSADPPPLRLYFSPLLPFLVWGGLVSFVRLKSWTCAWRCSWRDTSLFLWIVLLTGPLLLTNRVDAHRIFLFVIPLMMWTAFGFGEAAGMMGRLRVPGAVQYLLGAALAMTVFLNDINSLFFSKIPPTWAPKSFIAEEIEKVPGPVVLAIQADHRDVSWLNLVLIERERNDPTRKWSLLEEGVLRSLVEGGNRNLNPQCSRLESVLKDHTLLFAPARTFGQISDALGKRGARVAKRPPENPWLLRVDLGPESTGVADAELAAPLEVSVGDSPASPKLTQGPRVYVTDLEPLKSSHGFAPPRFDRAWSGDPIQMGGVPYSRGIGVHAWCELTYPVPKDAVTFQAIVGISDQIESCGLAEVSFEILDQSGKLLYKSGIMKSETPPKAVEVSVKGASAIALLVTEGEHGRDCDHANWALAAFVLERPDSSAMEAESKVHQ